MLQTKKIFISILNEIKLNTLSVRERLRDYKFDEDKFKSEGYKKEPIKTNTGHHLYTFSSDNETHHIWVNPKNNKIDLSIDSEHVTHPNGRTTLNNLYLAGGKRDGSESDPPKNMAVHGYNDLHRMGYITNHDDQSPGAIITQKRLSKLYPKTEKVYYDPIKEKPYSTSNIRPFVKYVGSKIHKLGPGLSNFMNRTTLSVSLPNSELDPTYRNIISNRAKREKRIRNDEF